MIAPMRFIPSYPSLRGSWWAGLGQAPEPFDLQKSIKDISATVTSIRPTAEFVGAHPYLTASLIFAAIIAGGAVGGYIGAGERAVRRRKAG